METKGRRRPKVHLILFCTEGLPFDTGKDLLRETNPLIEAGRKSFDSVRVHTPRSLIEADSSWEEYVSDVTEKIVSDERFSEDLPWNPGWARIGLFRWKPRLLLKELLSEETEPGDIVFYHDPDTSKYPGYLEGVERWPHWLRKRMRHLDVLAFDDNGAKMESDVKPDLIEHFISSRNTTSLRHIWAGAIGLRKSANSIAFATAWDKHSTFDALSPFTEFPTPTGFVWNSCDQAVLSALWNSKDFLPSSIRRDVQYLYRSRVIPPPSPLRLFVTKHTRRLRKKALALTGR